MVELTIPELDGSQVRMKDRNEVLKKIRTLMDDGQNKLQIITDFDRTMTKQHHEGKPSLSSYGIYRLIPSLPKEFVENSSSLYNRFRCIEEDPHMSKEEKLPHMVEWWELNEKLFLGLPHNPDEVDKAVLDSRVALRTGIELAFENLSKADVPTLVFSAGLGNIVEAVINLHKLNYDNVKIISNFFDIENGKIVGFLGTLLHVYNKNEHTIENTDYFKKLSNRGNVIVLGDSLGDANMAEGVKDEGQILKIGFLNSNIDEFLPQYLESFDIVLLDDQTMHVFNAILSKVLKT